MPPARALASEFVRGARFAALCRTPTLEPVPASPNNGQWTKDNGLFLHEMPSVGATRLARWFTSLDLGRPSSSFKALGAAVAEPGGDRAGQIAS
jgi:hypothetical protein